MQAKALTEARTARLMQDFSELSLSGDGAITQIELRVNWAGYRL
jgi:hypothetical protein